MKRKWMPAVLLVAAMGSTPWAMGESAATSGDDARNGTTPPCSYRLILGEDRTVAANAMKFADDAYVRQARAVRLDAKLLAVSSPLKAGDTIILDLLSNVTYSVVIDRVVRDPFHSLSISGTIAGAAIGTVNLTANNGAVIGTLQDLEKNQLYGIRRIGVENTCVVLDYDVANMPARWDLPGLEPPMVPSQEVQP